jgi:hypothetical protein
MADNGRLGFFSKLISWSELDFDQSQQIKSGEIILAQ